MSTDIQLDGATVLIVQPGQRVLLCVKQELGNGEHAANYLARVRDALPGVNVEVIGGVSAVLALNGQ